MARGKRREAVFHDGDDWRFFLREHDSDFATTTRL
jgi:hypothetical protein